MWYLAHGADIARMATLQAKTAVTDVKLVGLRRKIAEKMAISSSRIPHITYVEEVDVTGLEELRTTLNKQKRQDQPRLTLLPFLMRAMVRAIAEQPNLNSLFDDEAGVVHMHAGVHIGIAAQKLAGLMCLWAKHVEALDLWGCGVELNRLVEAAKAGNRHSRRTERINHYDHLSRRDGRPGYDAHYQSSRSRNRWR